MESTLRDQTDPGRATLQEAIALVVVHGPDPRLLGAERLVSEGETVVLGRGLEDVPGTGADPRLSRRHAALVCKGGTLRVSDLGSANGTFVNGERAAGADLVPGDVIGAGGHLLLVQRVERQRSPASHPGFAGRSRALGRVLEELALVAPRPTTVLVLGETGVGKELVARELHRQSGRKGAFVAVNCGAIGDGVLQSELFGHARGAFTGADRARRGLVEQADEGTLFLDEIGEASPAMQASLLRLLQEGELRAVGAERAVKVDVRFVAATWRPLEEAAQEGRFRPDLCARLSRWVIRVPPLRERPEDVPLLARSFAERYAGRPIEIARGLSLALVRYPWPGNVRELEAVIERLVVESRGADTLELTVSARELLSRPARNTEVVTAEAPRPARRPRTPKERPNADELRAKLAEAGGNVRALAESLGVGRSTLYRWMEELGVDPGDVRSGRG